LTSRDGRHIIHTPLHGFLLSAVFYSLGKAIVNSIYLITTTLLCHVVLCTGCSTISSASALTL